MAPKDLSEDSALVKEARRMARSKDITKDEIWLQIEDELQLPHMGGINLESLCRVCLGIERFKDWCLTEDWCEYKTVKIPIE
jgi:hypothetical protein